MAKKPSKTKKAVGNGKKRGVGRPPTSRGEDTRREIIEVATRLFIENKGELTSFESIANAAGMTRTALYYYFPSKADLARAVVMPVMDWNWWRIALEAPFEAESFQKRLFLLLSTALERSIQSEMPTSGYFSLLEASRSDDEIRAALSQHVGDMRQSVTEIVKGGVARGDLRPATDINSAIEAVMGLIWCIASGAANSTSARVNSQIAGAIRFISGE
jgi:AcrR family transcriptional regulator